MGNLESKEKEQPKQIKLKDIFENVKCKYILQIIFNNSGKKKLLSMIKYNNQIKNRINININDYKEYSEKYWPIEIEIKPVNNKYGKFVNIKKDDEKYFHIYFNNNKKEIKRNHINKNEEIKIIKMGIVNLLNKEKKRNKSSKIQR